MGKIKNEFVRGTAHVRQVGDKVREARLRWYVWTRAETECRVYW